MDLKITLSDQLLNGKINVTVCDLDDELKTANVDIFISGKGFLKTMSVPKLGGEEQTVIFEDTPNTGKTHNVRATISPDGSTNVSDSDNKMIELPLKI